MSPWNFQQCWTLFGMVATILDAFSILLPWLKRDESDGGWVGEERKWYETSWKWFLNAILGSLFDTIVFDFRQFSNLIHWQNANDITIAMPYINVKQSINGVGLHLNVLYDTHHTVIMVNGVFVRVPIYKRVLECAFQMQQQNEPGLYRNMKQQQHIISSLSAVAMPVTDKNSRNSTCTSLNAPKEKLHKRQAEIINIQRRMWKRGVSI